MDYFDKRNWETWANNNFDEFKSLKDGAKIAIFYSKQFQHYENI